MRRHRQPRSQKLTGCRCLREEAKGFTRECVCSLLSVTTLPQGAPGSCKSVSIFLSVTTLPQGEALCVPPGAPLPHL